MRSLSSRVLSTSTRKTVVSGVIIVGEFLFSLRLMRFVPQPDCRLGKVVLVAENAEARCAEQEVAAGGRFEAEPAHRQYPRDMRARKDRDVGLDGANALNDPVGPRRHLLRAFASRTAVAEQEPARPL